MKKNLKVFLLAILLCPILLLFACSSPAKYLITANPSDSNLGSVPISTDINFEEKDEGTKITLVAKEKHSDTNPFICWVKDAKEVVSNNKSLSLTYGEDTEGNYTAVFHETNVSSMSYASLSSLNFTTENSDYKTINYTISYQLSSFTDFIELNSGSFDVGEESKTNNFSVIYFGGAGSEREFKFKFSLEIASQSGSTTTFYGDVAGSIARNDFDSDGKCLIISDCVWHGENLGTFEFSFSKLTKDTF